MAVSDTLKTSELLADAITPKEALVETIIRPRGGWASLNLSGVWEFRELLGFLVWRDLKVRYKQTYLGVAWAVIQPLVSMVLFSVIFGQFAKLPSDNVPYPVFAYAALLPWNLFTGVVNRSGTSLVSSANLISKVYFPRLVVPLAAGLSSIVDFALSLLVLVGLMAYYRFVPGIEVLALPLWSLLALLVGLAVGVGLSALNVRFRDVGYLLPFLLQVWMYVSPVAYSSSIIPAKWAWLYQLNPMVGVIQGFRWSLLGTAGTMGVPWVTSLLLTLALLGATVLYFRQVERTFADVV